MAQTLDTVALKSVILSLMTFAQKGCFYFSVPYIHGRVAMEKDLRLGDFPLIDRCYCWNARIGCYW
jgi:hypothetical protein